MREAATDIARLEIKGVLPNCSDLFQLEFLHNIIKHTKDGVQDVY